MKRDSFSKASKKEQYDPKHFFSLNGKVTVITGASGVLGSEFARALAQFGSDIALLGRNGLRLRKVRRDVERTGAKAIAIVADVLSERDMRKAASIIHSKFGRIDILVNAHGTNLRIPTDKFALKDWEKVVDTNLKGTFISCKAFGHYMIAQKQGKIVNLSSTAGSFGYRWGYSAYSSSKGGMDALSRTLAVEWGRYGVRVNTVAPYFVHTSFTKKFLSDRKVLSEIVRDVPLGRIGLPIEVVGAILFFASSASDWVSGQTLYIDGGYSAH